jgi:hypothetical protein
MTPPKLLERNLALGQLLVDEPELVVLQEYLKPKLVLDDFLCGFHIKNPAGPPQHARLFAVGRSRCR